MNGDRQQFSLAELESFIAVFRTGSTTRVTDDHDVLIKKLADVLGRVLADAEVADSKSGSSWNRLKHDSYVGELLINALGLRTPEPESDHSSLTIRSIDSIEEAISVVPNLAVAVDYVFRLHAGERESDILKDLSNENGKSPESNKRAIARYRIAANRYFELYQELGLPNPPE